HRRFGRSRACSRPCSFAPVRAMLLAQAFAEYPDFVECVSGGKPRCRMGRAKRKPIVPCQAAMFPWCRCAQRTPANCAIVIHRFRSGRSAGDRKGDNSMIKPIRICNVSFDTPVLEKAIAYYGEFMGLIAAEREKDRAFLATKVGQLVIQLNKADRAHCIKLSFEVAPDSDFGE